MADNNHGLWEEKYRPDQIENYIADEELITDLKDYISSNNPPHLLFAGKPGCGKCLGYDECVDIEIELTNDEIIELKKLGVVFY